MNQAFKCRCPDPTTKTHNFMPPVGQGLLLEKHEEKNPQETLQHFHSEPVFSSKNAIRCCRSVFKWQQLSFTNRKTTKNYCWNKLFILRASYALSSFSEKYDILDHHFPLSIGSEMKELKVIITMQGRTWNYYIASTGHRMVSRAN